MLDFEALKVLGDSDATGKQVWQAVLEAGNILLHYRHQALEVMQKSDSSPVTQADLEAQKALVRLLEATGLPVVGEETEHHCIPGELPPVFWLTDPLDGTKSYLKGSDEFTVNLALIRHGQPVFGLIYAPALGVLYAGARGEGVKKFTRSGQSWEVDYLPEGLRRHKGILVLVSHLSGLKEPAFQTLAERLRSEGFQVVTRGGNSALKFGWLAEGSGHIYIRFKPCSSWDVAAGQALLEAGGGALEWPLSYETADVYGKHLFRQVPLPFTALARTDLKDLVTKGFSSSSEF